MHREESERRAFPHIGMSRWLQSQQAMSESAAQCGGREARHRYYELAAYVDVQVGRLLDHLDAKRLADSTLVVFTSDHGACLGDHFHFTKYSFFDCSWRVPLLMRGPGCRAARRASLRPASTLRRRCSACRRGAPRGMQGFSWCRSPAAACLPRYSGPRTGDPSMETGVVPAGRRRVAL